MKDGTSADILPRTGKLAERRNNATFDREHTALVQARSETGITDCTIVTWEDERELDDGIKVVPVWKWALRQKDDSGVEVN